MAAPILPRLVWRESPNQSARHAARVELVVLHETAGAYAGSVAWLCSPASGASAHLVVNEAGDEATQLVTLGRKAWTQGAFNSRAVSIELANLTAKGYHSRQQLDVAARIAAWLCWKLGIPPRWARKGVGRGLCYHGELGTAGGGHPYCGPDADGWARYVTHTALEIDRGDFRKTWAKL